MRIGGEAPGGGPILSVGIKCQVRIRHPATSDRQFGSRAEKPARASNYWQYFSTGSIRGKFNLVPQEGTALSSTSFTSETWVGTVTVTGGSGSYSTAAGKTGTIKCASADTVHLTCTEKIKLSSL